MKKTPIFIFGLIASIAIYDVYIIAMEGKDESISSYFIRWSFEYPMFTLGIGILIGHLFWSFDVKKLYVDKYKGESKEKDKK